MFGLRCLFSACLAVLLGFCVQTVAVADDTINAMDQISAEVLTRSTQSWNGSQLPGYPEGQPEISVVRVTIAAGAALPLHEHPYATAGYMVQGQIRVETPKGETRLINPGESMVELINQPHTGTSTGDEDAVILVFYAGIEGQPVTRLVEP